MSTPDVDIPHYIDSPIQMLWWEVDDVAPFLACLGAGIILSMTTPLMILGLFCSYSYIRHKRVSLDGTLEHIIYWFGLWQLNDKFNRGLEREYVE